MGVKRILWTPLIGLFHERLSDNRYVLLLVLRNVPFPYVESRSSCKAQPVTKERLPLMAKFHNET